MPVVCLLCAVLPLAAVAASGSGVEASLSQTNAQVDAVERRLELRSHSRFLASLTAADAQLQPFTSDGCSGGLSAGWKHLAVAVPAFAQVHQQRPPWESCCIIHDRAYHRAVAVGETAVASFDSRKRADLELERCVQASAEQRVDELAAAYGMSPDHVRVFYRAISALMYRVVRLGGVPCSGLAWRWGYGWPKCSN